ncbi:hypothetical protein [Harryflintia acetispora]|uniref:hypothetical protein n=1 Tax=Harryflintia acetispora TaxID=1849041 RepID=UPI00189824E0|nr:hypothetical protein [Harryflintia acetispora]
MIDLPVCDDFTPGETFYCKNSIGDIFVSISLSKPSKTEFGAMEIAILPEGYRPKAVVHIPALGFRKGTDPIRWVVGLRIDTTGSITIHPEFRITGLCAAVTFPAS